MNQQELSNATGLPLDSNLVQYYAPPKVLNAKATVEEITEIFKEALVERKKSK